VKPSKAWEYVQKLGPGWNLGNTLDAKHRWSDGGTPLQQEAAWRNPITRPEMIKAVRDMGFTTFRLPITWMRQLGPAPDYKINEEFMERVCEIVDYAFDCDMHVIINLHHEDWHFPSDENYPQASRILKKVWTQIAEVFEPCCDKVMFEAMNEPRKTGTDVEWSGGDEEGRRVVMQLNQDFVDTVRATGGNNATRMLLVPTYAASTDETAMADFAMPRGENLIASLHGYIPYPFALGPDHSINKWDADQEKPVDHLFAKINKHFLSKGIPVIMGECGARRKQDNAEDRAKWAAYYAGTAAKHGVPCIWWDNGYIRGPETSEVFGLLNRRTLEWPFENVARAFVDAGGAAK
jgi:endoglucanase